MFSQIDNNIFGYLFSVIFGKDIFGSARLVFFVRFFYIFFVISILVEKSLERCQFTKISLTGLNKSFSV